MPKIAICDDEPAVRKQMEAYFKELESVFCISYSDRKMYPGFTGSPVWQRRGTVTRSDIL